MSKYRDLEMGDILEVGDECKNLSASNDEWVLLGAEYFEVDIGGMSKEFIFRRPLEVERVDSARKLAEMVLNAHGDNPDYATRCDLARDVLKVSK